MVGFESHRTVRTSILLDATASDTGRCCLRVRQPAPTHTPWDARLLFCFTERRGAATRVAPRPNGDVRRVLARRPARQRQRERQAQNEVRPVPVQMWPGCAAQPRGMPCGSAKRNERHNRVCRLLPVTASARAPPPCTPSGWFRIAHAQPKCTARMLAPPLRFLMRELWAGTRRTCLSTTTPVFSARGGVTDNGATLAATKP